VLLSDLGAEVIKIESTKPDAMDFNRSIGRKIETDSGEQVVSPYFSYFNRNKKSVVLDLKKREGVMVLKDLVKISDVFLENFSSGVMERLGLSYEELRKINPELIYCSISGYGRSGPKRDAKGFDVIIQAESGIMSVNGPPNHPSFVNFSITDYLAGLNATVSILAALRYLEKGEGGQYIDISLLDSAIGVLDCAVEYYTYLQDGGRHGLLLAGGRAAYGKFACKNGEVAIAAGLSDGLWRRFCSLIRKEEYIGDPRTRSVQARNSNIEFVNQIVDNWTRERLSQEVVQACDAAGIPVSQVNNIRQVLNHPQLRSREMFVKVFHPILKREVETVGSALRMSKTPGRVQSRYPELGEHTEQVLRSLLNMTTQEVTLLRTAGVLQ
jgi:crotonobetainyl-CoA:carnitine CoA-transferase CaiB-like acyl-CoA transferase